MMNLNRLTLSDFTSTSSRKQDNKTYFEQARQIVYDLLMSNTATNKIPSLVNKMARTFNSPMDNVPQKTCVEMMQRELGKISDLYCSESLFSHKYTILAFDSTTQEGVHVNVITMATEFDTCVVANDRLPGGTA